MRNFEIYSVLRLTPLVVCVVLAPDISLAQQTDAGEDELAEIVLPGSQDEVFEEFEEDNLGDDPDLLLSQPVSTEQRLANLFKLYRDAMDDRMFAEADTLAKQIVELTIERRGIDSAIAARAITNLAIAQHGAKDYAAAALNFNSAIEIIERISDRLNEALINPLKGLAATQLALGNPGPASETYRRAMHISHVNYGPHNLQQIEVLESLAETFLAAGEYDEAIDLQERIFALQSRNIAAKSEEMLPPLISQARWLHRMRLFDKERYTWRRVISILEDKRGKEDLTLIGPLTELGKSYLYMPLNAVAYSQPVAPSTGEIYLKRAMRIAEKNPKADWDIKTQTMISLGDYYLLTDRPSRAERMYRSAWNLYSEDDARLRKRVETLQSLPVIQKIDPPKVYRTQAPGTTQPPMQPATGLETGSLVFQYTVSVRGTPTNIELIEAEPAGLDDMSASVAREVRRIVHRPRMANGQVETTDGVKLTHDFYYRPEDLPQDPEVANEAVNE
ncbi:MAG: tetratricopeptide repeat protein [Woeseia sp.]|nr:tetratricopeptide repeat protein [Woeseia sp.]